MTNPTPTPAEGLKPTTYRLLNDGEQIMFDDEIYSRDLWRSALEFGLDGRVKNFDAPVRRAIAPAVATSTGAWGYCPECGSDEIWHQEKTHKQCGNCNQEWHTDIDYSDVVQINLKRLFPVAHPKPVEGAGAAEGKGTGQ